jgi:hypothetical protein
MATVTTWTWQITSMQQWPSGTNAGYVVNVNWELTGTDGTQTASIGGNTQYPVTDAQAGFTPYASLTQAQVIGWVQESLGAQGIANFEANVQGQINSLENPPVSPTTQPLPWNA